MCNCINKIEKDNSTESEFATLEEIRAVVNPLNDGKEYDTVLTYSLLRKYILNPLSSEIHEVEDYKEIGTPVIINHTYCPFCGVKYPERKS